MSRQSHEEQEKAPTCSLCSINGIVLHNTVCPLCALGYGLACISERVSKASEEAVGICMCVPDCCSKEAGTQQNLPVFRLHAVASHSPKHLQVVPMMAARRKGRKIPHFWRQSKLGRFLKLPADSSMHLARRLELSQQTILDDFLMLCKARSDDRGWPLRVGQITR